MSRLYDRVIAHGCGPLTTRMLLENSASSFEEFRQGVRRELESRIGPLSDEKAAEGLLIGLRGMESRRAHDVLDAQALAGAVVIAGDDVGRYVADLPKGTDIGDVVSVVAPPFERFFVDFNIPDSEVGLTAWGVLFTSGSLSTRRKAG